MLHPSARPDGRSYLGTCLAWRASPPPLPARTTTQPPPPLLAALRGPRGRPAPMPPSASLPPVSAESDITYPVTVSVKTEAALEAARAAFGTVRGERETAWAGRAAGGRERQNACVLLSTRCHPPSHIIQQKPTMSAGPAATAALALPSTVSPPVSSSAASPAPPFPPPPFDPAAALARLGTARLGHVILTASALPSTQTLVQAGGAGLPDGLVAVADVQVSGRGRAGNVWSSPPGCLMASALIATSPIPGARLPFVQYAVALAVVRGVKRLVGEAAAAAGWGEADARAAGEGADVRIKWPNDVLAGEARVLPTSPSSPSSSSSSPSPPRKKLAGVLCHSTCVSGAGGSGPGAAGVFRIVAGFGVNVTNEPPRPSQPSNVGGPSTSETDATAGPLDWARVADLVPWPPPGRADDPTPPHVARAAAVEAAGGRPALLASVLAEVEAGLGRLASSGESWAAGGADSAAYLAAWLHTGQAVTVVDSPAEGGGGGDRRGGPPPPPPGHHLPRPPPGKAVTITGLAPSGYLLAVDTATGAAYELHPDGNSLDFFQGLVRRKVVVAPPTR